MSDHNLVPTLTPSVDDAEHIVAIPAAGDSAIARRAMAELETAERSIAELVAAEDAIAKPTIIDPARSRTASHRNAPRAARQWKTHLFLLAMQNRWATKLLTSVGRKVPCALKSPNPMKGGSETWEYLGDLSEVARYSVIVGLIRRLRPNASVLDVGSSNGVLAEELRWSVRKLRGIEFDPVSVERANERNIDGAEFLVADANTYTTADRFDVVVFNETLYYLHDPMELLQRYAGFLKPGGVIIVSNFVARYLLKFPGEIARNFDVIEQASVVNSRGFGWTIQALRNPAEAE
jgi:SAM-dependent methyltransferase